MMPLVSDLRRPTEKKHSAHSFQRLASRTRPASNPALSPRATFWHHSLHAHLIPTTPETPPPYRVSPLSQSRWNRRYRVRDVQVGSARDQLPHLQADDAQCSVTGSHTPEGARGRERGTRQDARAGITSRAGTVGRGWDGETRRQNGPNLCHVPFIRRPEKRLVIILEQLLALLCILGLAGRLRFEEVGLG